MDLPMIIEIVDSEEKIQSFLPVLDGMVWSRWKKSAPCTIAERSAGGAE